MRLWSFTCYEERNDIYPSLSLLFHAWFVLKIPFLLFSLHTVLFLIVPKKGDTSRTFQPKKATPCLCVCGWGCAGHVIKRKKTITKKEAYVCVFFPRSFPCPPFRQLFIPPLLLCNFIRKRPKTQNGKWSPHKKNPWICARMSNVSFFQYPCAIVETSALTLLFLSHALSADGARHGRPFAEGERQRYFF